MSLADLLGDSDEEHGRFVYVLAGIAALNGLLFGFDIGVISGALLYIEQAFGLSTFLQEAVVSGVLVGAMLGAAMGGRLSDRFGRRRLTLAGAATFFVGSIGMALSPGVYVLIGWRFVVGVAVGVASVVGPLHISETAPPDIRGSLGSLQQLAITLGILLAYLVNYAFAGSGGWRWMLGFGAVPAVVLAVGMYFLPESPRWLVDHDRPAEAREVLSRIRVDTDIDEEMEQIREVSEIESEGGLSDLLQPWLRPALIVGVGLAIFQQISGINTVIYYAPTILQSTGFSNLASIAGTIGVGLINVLMTVVAILLVDRVGRRPLLLVGTAGMTVMLALLGFAFWMPSLSGALGWATVAGLILYVAFYAVSLGPVFWLMISEIYPLRIRGTAEGTASVANWGANLVVALTYLTLTNAIGQSWSFWLYGVLSAVAFLFVYTRVPETMGRSLEEIEADLRENVDAGAGEAPSDRDHTPHD